MSGKGGRQRVSKLVANCPACGEVVAVWSGTGRVYRHRDPRKPKGTACQAWKKRMLGVT